MSAMKNVEEISETSDSSKNLDPNGGSPSSELLNLSQANDCEGLCDTCRTKGHRVAQLAEQIEMILDDDPEVVMRALAIVAADAVEAAARSAGVDIKDEVNDFIAALIYKVPAEDVVESGPDGA
jgi:hypothetical protein